MFNVAGLSVDFFVKDLSQTFWNSPKEHILDWPTQCLFPLPWQRAPAANIGVEKKSKNTQYLLKEVLYWYMK